MTIKPQKLPIYCHLLPLYCHFGETREAASMARGTTETAIGADVESSAEDPKE